MGPLAVAAHLDFGPCPSRLRVAIETSGVAGTLCLCGCRAPCSAASRPCPLKKNTIFTVDGVVTVSGALPIVLGRICLKCGLLTRMPVWIDCRDSRVHLWA